ncbi:hypothetical protein BpHYR1_037908 [Brachionus plicatilis]|uniref:Uncharacterized protein n=1 Tax=Brachionus plicatilis TaxID=10195 RepID=A0A3M7SPM3_BRAPC|nr:hypothetical protein BpHYR1_037908 [Brachionus plicatilis]
MPSFPYNTFKKIIEKFTAKEFKMFDIFLCLDDNFFNSQKHLGFSSVKCIIKGDHTRKLFQPNNPQTLSHVKFTKHPVRNKNAAKQQTYADDEDIIIAFQICIRYHGLLHGILKFRINKIRSNSAMFRSAKNLNWLKGIDFISH